MIFAVSLIKDIAEIVYNKGEVMGLDQYGMIRNGHINWKKVYSDKYEPTKDGFVWRKHARLQKFMAKEFTKQNPKPSLSHLTNQK